eukprot:TRINITY_DN11970_c0_g1_i1.p1 TRINITY_DN11970_c0_g1~~TRINITY_DN11970_c0_g1_i1.p1  ORF type:complete len:642 (+),score=127.54 TRINITY_DN11970_c0_g1_i1:32-1957(+)
MLHGGFSKDAFVKNVTSAVVLEEELILSWKERGITVADVYSGNWGPCKAITPTFRRLFYETDEEMRLRFLTVDANSVIAELEGGTEAPKKKKKHHTIEPIKDTLPERWKPLLERQCDSPKPLFIFWKEGTLVTAIEGVNTPSICEIVQDLTTIKVPASEFITNADLLETWGQFFNPGESEIKWEHFTVALNAVCMLTVPLDDEETTKLKKQLKVERDRVVHAQELQNWVGPAPGTMLQAFTTLLPGYEARAIRVRLEQEAEARRQQEERERLERERIEQERRAAEEKERKEAEARRILTIAALTELPPSEPSSRSGSVTGSRAMTPADKPAEGAGDGEKGEEGEKPEGEGEAKKEGEAAEGAAGATEGTDANNDTAKAEATEEGKEQSKAEGEEKPTEGEAAKDKEKTDEGEKKEGDPPKDGKDNQNPDEQARPPTAGFEGGAEKPKDDKPEDEKPNEEKPAEQTEKTETKPTEGENAAKPADGEGEAKPEASAAPAEGEKKAEEAPAESNANKDAAVEQPSEAEKKPEEKPENEKPAEEKTEGKADVSFEGVIVGDGDVAKLQEYLTAGGDVNALVDAKKKETLLHWAAAKGNIELAVALLDAKADFNLKNADGQTPIFVAQEESHMPLVQKMLDRGIPF